MTVYSQRHPPVRCKSDRAVYGQIRLTETKHTTEITTGTIPHCSLAGSDNRDSLAFSSVAQPRLLWWERTFSLRMTRSSLAKPQEWLPMWALGHPLAKRWCNRPKTFRGAGGCFNIDQLREHHPT
jgi:hypothetical protein